MYIKFHQAQQQGSPLSIILNVTDNVKNAASLERNLRRIHHASGNLAAGFTAKQILHRTGNIFTDSLGITVGSTVFFHQSLNRRSTNLNTLNHLQFSVREVYAEIVFFII